MLEIPRRPRLNPDLDETAGLNASTPLWTKWLDGTFARQTGYGH
ncbi:MAG: hypothetical protein U5Q44_08710 [Dehalococcoidia bacterium]|nr:hypothetical protein [Dehalococcoidia bacterium]